jgi:hypothetical protein
MVVGYLIREPLEFCEIEIFFYSEFLYEKENAPTASFT